MKSALNGAPFARREAAAPMLPSCSRLVHRAAIFLAIGLALTVVAAIPSGAQTSGPAVDNQTPALSYDIVSVKPAHPAPGTSFYWRTTPDGFTATTTVQNLIQNGWDFMLEDQMVDLPGWAKSDLWEIVAKMDPDTYAAFRKLSDDQQDRQRRRMIQAILADRFRLQAHRESRPLPVYALVVAKGKSKLTPADPRADGGWSTGHGRIAGHRMETSDLADRLSGALGRIVVDRTGLKGDYNVTLTWAPDDQPGLPDSGPSLFTALEEQLGLRLEPTRAPVPCLVIDRIERPSAN